MLTYDKLFNVLAEHGAFTEGIPGVIMCDFERNLLSALNKHLPWAEVRTVLEVKSQMFVCRNSLTKENIRN
jgi:hypothetical protein